MNIGIVTNLDSKNYGSVLQAYSLQKKLLELGNQCITFRQINKNKTLKDKVKSFFTKSKNGYSFSDRLSIKKSRKKYSKKNQKLNEFCELNINSRYFKSINDILAISQDLDLLLAGSDQIWSPKSGLLNDYTTLNIFSNNIKKASFAASVAVDELKEEDIAIFDRAKLADFKMISVRERSSIKLMERFSKSNLRFDLDPVFLYNKDEWTSLMGKKLCEEDYIFVYVLRPEPKTLAYAKKLAKEKNCKLFVCSNRIFKDPDIINVVDAGPKDFLSYIYYAKFIVTNSFHGTAFSIILHKQFMSFAVEGTGARVLDLLDFVGLNDRLINKGIDIDESINWMHVDSIIENKRQDSISYLASLDDNKKMIFDPISLYGNESQCCGCGACENACPQKAILMQENEDGFYYPMINDDLCIKCKLCKKVCVWQNVYTNVDSFMSSWACASKEEKILNKSASGGVFAAIAEFFINEGGIVYGASYVYDDSKIGIKHIRVDKIEDLEKLQSSKYAQSSIDLILKKVKEDLVNGKNVLFSGTPCQIAGLKGFLLNKQYDNLYTIDVICHGVPSQKLLQSYCGFISKKYNSRVSGINFRDKKFGWASKGSIFLTNGKEVPISAFDSSYFKLFISGKTNRMSCYHCHYTGRNRPGDLTLGDFWGFEAVHKDYIAENGGKFKQCNGISCVTANNKKGSQLLKQYGDNINIESSTIENIIYKNKSLIKPSIYDPDREIIYRLNNEIGYEAVDNWFWKKYGRSIRIIKVWNKVPLPIRKIVRIVKNII